MSLLLHVPIVHTVRYGRLRASPHVYNTDREIDQLVEALPKHWIALVPPGRAVLCRPFWA